ncbi:TMEM175 family protein [Pseudonocardia endophytica]|uniref:Putative membrane protein n=1 Tax=Pseudonocardia endophytica TaxID=401976 RepID=A0A4R1HKR6_PSEEN|nr:TMEM175 family protein [Pseudonocardia endophytica]TCK22528.1 putative membrane protein [Pseudonocardia endophytica]
MDETRSAIGHGLERTMAFSDGVFAIAITLLVLPLTDAEIDGDRIGESLLALAPTVLSFVLSFAVIGRYWILHHNVVDRLTRADGTVLVLNLVYLFWIVILPFPTSVLGEHGPTTASILLYGVNLVAIGVSSLALWWYASRHRALLQPSVTERERTVRLARTIAPTIGMIPALPLAVVSPRWAALSWLLVIPTSWIGDRLFPETEPVD